MGGVSLSKKISGGAGGTSADLAVVGIPQGGTPCLEG